MDDVAVSAIRINSNVKRALLLLMTALTVSTIVFGFDSTFFRDVSGFNLRIGLIQRRQVDNSASADSRAITCLAVDPESNPRRRAEPTAAAFWAVK